MATATQYVEVEVWVLVDESGDYAVAANQDDLVTAYEDSVQALSDAGATRRVKMLVKVPLPKTAVLVGTVSEESDAELTAAE